MKMKNVSSVWKVLFGITSLLFFIIGFAKIIADRAVVEGSVILAFALFLLIIEIFMLKGKIVMERQQKRKSAALSLGFIFLIIGIATLKSYGLAGFGFILMLVGLLQNNQEGRKS